MLGVFSDLAGAKDWASVVLVGGACLAAILAAFGLLRRQNKPSALTADTNAKLRERNICLDAALNNMTQGLCMFDASERIVVLNRRFLEMYKLSPQVVRAR
jgi:PAS domain-containing protein